MYKFWHDSFRQRLVCISDIWRQKIINIYVMLVKFAIFCKYRFIGQLRAVFAWFTLLYLALFLFLVLLRVKWWWLCKLCMIVMMIMQVVHDCDDDYASCAWLWWWLCKFWFKCFQRFRIYRVHKISMFVAAWHWPLTPNDLENLTSSSRTGAYLCAKFWCRLMLNYCDLFDTNEQTLRQTDKRNWSTSQTTCFISWNFDRQQ